MLSASPGDSAGGGDPARPIGDTGPAWASNRDRLLAGYLAFLRSDPARVQSNGLRGADLADACDLWAALHPSDRDTFLTVTARLEGSVLATDGSSMLDHVTTAYRVVGGERASPTGHGSCGGGEFNRLVLSMDETLRAAVVAAHANEGRAGGAGAPDVADVPPGGFWRDFHDPGGPHAPFTRSVETEDGAPRGQAHFFADPASPAAAAPLGRRDLEGLVDPCALEVDQDHDCVHSSNPDCRYTLYGPLCAPRPTRLGTEIYEQTYGDWGATFTPEGC